ncbi:TetR/AcrR family transcriptional regulator [uncultured Microbacterium sp.]|uniref:TetR/AcrR family transcriptional regulator n=1 Tax=uncultured Microbacterium sp. TaxID=191216 RepID=UPI0035CB0B9F
MAASDPDGAGTRRNDPDRRDRIIDACLDVLADVGVAGTSHRRVAAAAGVPLGSMTYHFSGMDELLREAFARMSLESSARLRARMAGATDRDSAKRAVIEHIQTDIFASTRELVLTHELYTLAARDPSYKDITHAWMDRTRRLLEQQFDPTTARLLDALVEGLTIHRAIDTQPQDPGLVRLGVERITASSKL